MTLTRKKVHPLLNRGTQLGRLFAVALRGRRFSSYDLPESIGGVRVGDRLNIVKRIYDLRTRWGLNIRTGDLPGSNLASYALVDSPCPICKGAGRMSMDFEAASLPTCETCSGAGIIPKRRKQ
jgi:hypothetical protein